jgi:hypothetical protein
MNLEDVRVGQGGHGPGLALKTLEPVRIVGDRGGQDLHRHVATKTGIGRPIYLSHSALADLLDDAVGAKAAALEVQLSRNRTVEVDGLDDGLIEGGAGFERVLDERFQGGLELGVPCTRLFDELGPVGGLQLESGIEQLSESLPPVRIQPGHGDTYCLSLADRLTRSQPGYSGLSKRSPR